VSRQSCPHGGLMVFPGILIALGVLLGAVSFSGVT
jgi:hypothetical protein